MKCEICEKEAISVIRTISVCRMCFSILQNDNYNRTIKNIDIPNNINILRKCFRYKCRVFFESEIKYYSGVLIDEYCSKECEIKQKGL